MKKSIYFFMFCLTGFLFSCSEDEAGKSIEHQYKNVNKKNVSLQEMKQFFEEHSTNGLPTPLQFSLNRGDSTYITQIDTTSIVQIINENVISFTLHINTLDDEFYAYSNLVIKSYDGETHERILHYNPTAEWQQAFDSGERLPYDGQLLITDIYGDEISISSNHDESESKGGNNCMIIVFVACYGSSCPCSDGNGQTFYVTVPCDGGGGNPGDGSNEPTNPGGFPTDPNPGSGGSSNNQELNPCQLGKKLKTDANFRAKMQNLKNSAQNDNIENGFLMSPDGSVYTYEQIQGLPNSPEIPLLDYLESGENYAGLIHAHYDDPEILSVFSVGDLASLYYMYYNGYMTTPNKNFVMGLVTADETTYLIVIDDYVKFDNFGQNSLSDESGLDNLQLVYQSFPYSILPTSSNTHNEHSLAKFLKHNNTGLKLMKGNYLNFYNWKTVDVDNNGNVTTNQCP